MGFMRNQHQQIYILDAPLHHGVEDRPGERRASGRESAMDSGVDSGVPVQGKVRSWRTTELERGRGRQKPKK